MLRERVNQWEWLDGAPRVRVLKEYPQSTSKQSKRMRPPDRNRLSSPRVTGLSWSQVDLTRRTAWVHADQAKARKAIAVPLSAAAVIVIREQIGSITHMFSFRGKPVRQVNTKAWRLSLKRAGIKDFRWHDLRHTWASWHVQAGTPLHVLQELGSWESRGDGSEVTRISPAIISCEYVDRMSGA